MSNVRTGAADAAGLVRQTSVKSAAFVTPTPFAALCREMWAGAAAMLGPGQDHTAMAQLSERLAGEVLGGNK